MTEEDLLGAAERWARAALDGVARQPPERCGWSLLAGHAGVYCAGALVLSASAELAQRLGRGEHAAGLRQQAEHAVAQYVALQRLACSAECEEDEVLCGRSGYLLGCLLLNHHLRPGSVPAPAMQEVVSAIIHSGEWGTWGRGGAGSGWGSRAPGAALAPRAGRSLAGRLRARAAFPAPLFYMWPPGPDAAPYLGAAHGLMGEPCARPPTCLQAALERRAAAARCILCGTTSRTWAPRTA